MKAILSSRIPLQPQPSLLPGVRVQAFPAHHYFTQEVESELAHDDQEAWTAVCTVLITIVSLGLIIGIAAVWLSL